MECHHKIQLRNGAIVPCGKCPACKANLRQEWVFRLKQEYLDSAFSIFVTLTYDEEHVPLDFSVNKEDVQLFHKRLRKHFPPGDLRFYLVSEYGDHTFRPHYHGLYFFNSKYDIEKVYDIFLKSWKNGFIKFGEVEEGSIVYCTKYCLKHSSTPPGRKETFRLVSKMNGGLGINYLQKMNDYHAENLQLSYVSYNGQKCRMPRYYRTKLQFSSGLSPTKEIQYQTERRVLASYAEQVQKFKDFLAEHRGLSYDEAIKQFNVQQIRGFEERDKLVIKHTKKQKM